MLSLHSNVASVLIIRVFRPCELSPLKKDSFHSLLPVISRFQETSIRIIEQFPILNYNITIEYEPTRIQILGNYKRLCCAATSPFPQQSLRGLKTYLEFKKLSIVPTPSDVDFYVFFFLLLCDLYKRHKSITRFIHVYSLIIWFLYAFW